MTTSAAIRQQFLDFFQSKAHTIVPSAPIVIKNDPTLLFTNAGMNQFKDYFLGNRTAPSPRVADTQKCLRVSGKHNDLEEVGVDTYHHTMFEMLGNWSFGDPNNPSAGYFKKEAIAWSWELLTEVYKIPKDRLYVTVFEGDEKENLPFDEEAFSEWKRWIAEERILKGNKKDNFWEMGDTGPCGPCSEIHVDCRSDEERAAGDGSKLVNADHPQVIEIWNNVFMQFNRLKDGSLQPLPAKHVDTGMGFERLVRVLQGKQSNYDTDVFTGTIAEIERITAKKYDFSDTKEAIAFRVLADHIRAIAFTIADGQLPSNTGAGYVIRRILRRAVRYYYSYLDFKTPLLFQLMPALAKQFETVFSELHNQLEFVSKVVKEEEEAFLRTLDKGLKRLDDLFANTKEGTALNGASAFELYDTYGFPLDLTKLIASEKGYAVDEPGFEAEMLQQKNRSRAATAVDTEDWTVLDEDAFSEFVGYDTLEIRTKIVKYRKVKAKGKEGFQIVLEASPFYAESGGQVGDTGELVSGEQRIAITDTKKENNLVIVFADEVPPDPKAPVTAIVDKSRREAITLHHSATHLMHAALREVLGTHVAQKGSLVNASQLRFDFSHFSKMSDEEIQRVEDFVNKKIRENIPVVIKEMPKEEAIAMGAMALFGEKYSDTVRVVIMDPNYSIELCGGTHVGATGELGYFLIQSESAVAAGVRRIEALCGAAATTQLREQQEVLKKVKETFKNPKDLIRAAEQLLQDNSDWKKKAEKMEAKLLTILKEELVQQKEMLGNIEYIGTTVDVSGMDALRKLAMDLKPALPNGVAVLSAVVEGKPQVAVLVADGLAAQGTEAPKIIKELITPLIKGGGGGQKTLATAGGQDTARVPEISAAVKSWILDQKW